MQILHTPDTIRALSQQWLDAGKRIALVPTMGAHHAGHASLMAYARAHADKVIVSLFVNPAQFAPGEDLTAYPRDFEGDTAIAKAEGVDALFAPTPEVMYPPGHATTICVPALSKTLCGLARPTHFNGVCLVVLKLLHITLPHIAVFGEKDWQQLAIVRRMVCDINIPVDIVACPIVREADGLAMSSRNVYMTEAERIQAPQIREGLLYAQTLVKAGKISTARLCEAVLAQWAQRLPLGRVDYLSVVDKDTLAPLETVWSTALMACAVYMGRARLLDNILFSV